VRFSRLFGRTLRKPPADATTVGLGLAVRSGLIRPLGAGDYAYLPLGWRVMQRAKTLLQATMADLGGQEIRLPSAARGAPAAIAELARREVRSYRDLPRLLYQFRAVSQDRRGGGLLGIREVWRMEAFGLHSDGADQDALAARMLAAWEGVLARCGLEGVWVEAGVGRIEADALLVPLRVGGERLLRCSQCGYAATAEAARFRLPPAPKPPPEPARPVATPDCATIADVAAYVGVETSQTLKAVFYAWDRPGREPTLVFVVIRGDLEVNQAKLQALLGEGDLRPASDGEIRAAGAEPGYASPVGLRVRSAVEGEGVLVVGDRSIQAGANFVAGANREGYHLVGVNYPRDFAVTLLADVAQAQPGSGCPRCEGRLQGETALELAWYVQWGREPAEQAGAAFLDPEGRGHPPLMVSYGFDLTGLLTAVLETHYDEAGIVWPPALAPFDVHLISLARSEAEQVAAERIYERLRGVGLEVLYDDRGESAGVKFADADLIGCPVRVTVGRRSLEQGGAEVKARWSAEQAVLSEESLVEGVAHLLDRWPGV